MFSLFRPTSHPTPPRMTAIPCARATFPGNGRKVDEIGPFSVIGTGKCCSSTRFLPHVTGSLSPHVQSFSAHFSSVVASCTPWMRSRRYPPLCAGNSTLFGIPVSPHGQSFSGHFSSVVASCTPWMRCRRYPPLCARNSIHFEIPVSRHDQSFLATSHPWSQVAHHG